MGSSISRAISCARGFGRMSGSDSASSLEKYKQREFYVLNDAAYDRMQRKLKKSKAGFEWSYLGVGERSQRPKFMNVLKQGKIVRIVDSKQKPVYRASEAVKLAMLSDPSGRCEMDIDWFAMFDDVYYAKTLREAARRGTFPLVARIHYRDTTKTVEIPTLAAFESFVDYMLESVLGPDYILCPYCASELL